LWASCRNLENSGAINRFLFEAEDIAKQAELGVGNYAPEEENKSSVQSVADDVVLGDELWIDGDIQGQLDSMLRRWGVPEGFANYYAIDNEGTLEQIINYAQLTQEEADELRDDYSDPDVIGVASADKGIVIIFANKVFLQKRLCKILAHETSHIAYKELRA
ncbi:MAG: hypothetical protein ACI30R_09315, partial [Sodaliphilus sp.]